MEEELLEEKDNNEVQEEKVEDNVKTLEKEIKKVKKRRKGRIISNIIITIIFLFIIFEAAIGIINMQRINDKKEPVMTLSKKENNTENKEETVYNLGLYKIVKTDILKGPNAGTRISLKPFFVE